jgi:hypothetical protein
MLRRRRPDRAPPLLGLVVSALFGMAACTDGDTSADRAPTTETSSATTRPEVALEELGPIDIIFDSQGQGYWCPSGYYPTCPSQCISEPRVRLDGLTLDPLLGTTFAAAALDLECRWIPAAHVSGNELPEDAFHVQAITAGGEHLVLESQ